MSSAAREVPLFPLNTVLFPGGRLPLRIFEQRYMTMVKTCLKDGSAFGVCLIRTGGEVGVPAEPVEVGCLATIGEWDMPQLGVLNVIAHGTQRFRIVSTRIQPDGLAVATIEHLPDAADEPVPAEFARVANLLRQAMAAANAPVEDGRFQSADWVSARLAELLPIPLGIRQSLLELDSGAERLKRVASLLAAGRPAR